MSYIIYNKENQVACITLNRPEKFNSFCREMALQMQEALQDATNDKDVRCVYITGNGKAFCAGQDLQEAIEDNGIELKQIVLEHYNPIIQLISKMNKPVVCAVNGVAAGAGANIALACDIVVAVENATFIQAFSKIGLIPDSGGTYFLPRLIGKQKAAALMMTGDKIDAIEAERLGMIYKYFSVEEFEIASKKMAEQLATMPTKGIALTKQLLNISEQNDLITQLNEEANHQVEAANSFDYNEGVNAFLEKRKPQFKGC